MKRAAAWVDILVIIIAALVCITIFIVFATGQSASLFSQWGRLEPETAGDACKIACNQAKVNENCDWWCARPYGDGPDKCYEHMDCDIDDCECEPTKSSNLIADTLLSADRRASRREKTLGK